MDTESTWIICVSSFVRSLLYVPHPTAALVYPGRYWKTGSLQNRFDQAPLFRKEGRETSFVLGREKVSSCLCDALHRCWPWCCWTTRLIGNRIRPSSLMLLLKGPKRFSQEDSMMHAAIVGTAGCDPLGGRLLTSLQSRDTSTQLSASSSFPHLSYVIGYSGRS